MVWLTVWLCTRKLADSKWVINIAGVCKILIFILIGLAGILFVAKGNPMANVVTAQTVTPTLNDGLKYLPVIIYLCCGMEVLSANSQEMRNPKKDMPRAVIGLVVLCIAMNLLASWGTLATVPVQEIDLLTGVHRVIETGFGSGGFASFVLLLLLFCIFAQIVVWFLGGAVGASEAGQDGEMPKMFAKQSEKTGAPVGALVMTGTVSSSALILYGFLASNASDLFFTLLAFSSIIYFMPYMIMFPAFIKLRNTDNTPRSFKAPAGKVLAVICEIILIGAAFLFVWVPVEPFNPTHSLPIIIGVIATVLLGEIIVKTMIRKKRLMLD